LKAVVSVQRLSIDDFLAQVLREARDLPEGLQERILKVAAMKAGARVRELQKAFEEAARG
jgi:hypothetical protein